MDNVTAFAEQRKSKRHIVTMNGVRLALPEVWTAEKWDKLNQRQRLFIFRSCTQFRFYLQHVYLRYKSEVEGEEYPEELPEFMGRFADAIQARVPAPIVPFDHKVDEKLPWRICRVWPTGCFKSSLLEAFESWLMGINPNITIVKGLSAAELGERFVDFHTANIDENEIYRQVFGDLNPGSTRAQRVWRKDSFTVQRSLQRSAPTYKIVGYRGSFEGTRFDVGLLDDLVDENNSRTEDARLQQYNWVNNVFERRLHPKRRMLFAIGTIHHRTDFYHHCKEHATSDGSWDYEEITMIARQDVDAGLWPPAKKNQDLPYSMENVVVPPYLNVLWDFWTPEKLVEDFIANRHAFARTRQNQIHDPDLGMFTEQDLDFCLADGGQDPNGRQKPELTLWRYTDGIPAVGSPIYEMYERAGISIEYGVVTADFAATDKKPGKDPDFTVFELWGWCRNTQRRVFLDMWRFQTGNPNVMKTRLVQFIQNYLPIVRRIAGEANAVDKLFVRDLSTFVKEKLGVGVGIVELRGEKEELIESFKDLIYDNAVWIPYSVRSPRTRREMGVFKEELVEYPEGKHDDTLIAGVHHLRLLKSGSFSGGVEAIVVGGEEAEAVTGRRGTLLPEADLGQMKENPWVHIREERERSRCQTQRTKSRTAREMAGFR